MELVEENSVKIKVEIPKKDVHAKMEVFYNPLMKSNRNISVLLLNSVDNKKMNLALPLAGSGIRGLRFLQELEKGKINHLFLNDKKDNFVKMFNENLKLNKISKAKENSISVFNQEASLFLLNLTEEQNIKDFCGYFDYIDLDPFGSPNPFLSVTLARITRKGIIAITATDTAALTGTYPKVTKRKYWARSMRNDLMHEIGLRILIRKVQLHGVQFDKALVPILSYHKDHYFRVYFVSNKGKENSDEVIKEHQYLLSCPKCLSFKISNYNQENCSCGWKYDYAGPLWTGKLFDQKLLQAMLKNNPFPEEEKFLQLLNDEMDTPFFYDLHALSKKYKTDPPKMELALKKLKGTRTHFSLTGLKTEKSLKEVLKVVLSSKK
ncbi:MAG: tRNA (guanine(26)-N(2))-dimethyltransferase [Nanoarchaeota archaeon]|nr:tRNA (guanine(26)-N(2))-dimethyltransferase [Nanoarchaeota archaeon]MBU1644111.1 tRNA (guanine(26)-N(2))-dimethyltransferase [Nanoarchaeota archaeon]MBU1976446.1 tRNA (guanine(26)-N(2))-dimethyltransferase [Nanoarchaeota archaeon]